MRNGKSVVRETGTCGCCQDNEIWGGVACDVNRSDVPGCAAYTASTTKNIRVNINTTRCRGSGLTIAQFIQAGGAAGLGPVIMYGGVCFQLNSGFPQPDTAPLIEDAEVQCVGYAGDGACQSDLCTKALYVVGEPCNCGEGCYAEPKRVLACVERIVFMMNRNGSNCAFIRRPGNGGQCFKFTLYGEVVATPSPNDIILTDFSSTDTSCCQCCAGVGCTGPIQCGANANTSIVVSNGTIDFQAVDCGTVSQRIEQTNNVVSENLTLGQCCCNEKASYSGFSEQVATMSCEASIGCFCITTNTLSVNLVKTGGFWKWVGTNRVVRPACCGYPAIDTTEPVELIAVPYTDQTTGTTACGPNNMSQPALSASCLCPVSMNDSLYSGQDRYTETTECDSRYWNFTRGRDYILKWACYSTGSCNITATTSVQRSTGACESGNCQKTRTPGGSVGEQGDLLTKLLKWFKIRTNNPLVGAGAFT